MAKTPPISVLLSHALVAFTIEFDNQAELRIPHRTTRFGESEDDPTQNASDESVPASDIFSKSWLVSMAMYLNCMQFVDDKGISARDLVQRARARTNFRGMHRWGYISVEPPAEGRNAPKAEWIVRPTAAGRLAQQIWKPLIGEIEERWIKRFGRSEIEGLRNSLARIEESLDLDLPDCMPILGYGLWSNTRKYKSRDSGGSPECRLPVLMARLLLAFALEFENNSELSIAMTENVMRVLDDEGVLVRDMPRRAGISTEAIAMAVKFLISQGYALLDKDPAGARANTVRLTAKGLIAQDAGHKSVRKIEREWRERFGATPINALRKSLLAIVGGATQAQLFRGLEPPPNGWRAKIKKPKTLPYFPMVLHRGGYPDGS